MTDNALTGVWADIVANHRDLLGNAYVVLTTYRYDKIGREYKGYTARAADGVYHVAIKERTIQAGATAALQTLLHEGVHVALLERGASQRDDHLTVLFREMAEHFGLLCFWDDDIGWLTELHPATEDKYSKTLERLRMDLGR